jgi:hypothetical protein
MCVNFHGKICVGSASEGNAVSCFPIEICSTDYKKIFALRTSKAVPRMNGTNYIDKNHSRDEQTTQNLSGRVHARTSHEFIMTARVLFTRVPSEKMQLPKCVCKINCSVKSERKKIVAH